MLVAAALLGTAQGVVGHLSAAAAIPTFTTCGFTPYPSANLPFQSPQPVSLIDDRLHDAQGVRVIRIRGEVFNQPVLQAEYGLLNLNAYRLTHDWRYLRRAIAQANRLVATHVHMGDAWFEPYRYEEYLHGLRTDLEKPPWYSAMAQGEALSLFVRLYEVTKNRHWEYAAKHTFASFLVPASSKHPWIDHVDKSGYLWLDEFAYRRAGRSDLTYNGHNFASYGLYDYVMLTHDVQAAKLLDGAWCTAAHYAPTFRRAGWQSSYCLAHPDISTAKYHQVVIAQFDQIYALSHQTLFADFADEYVDDFPYQRVAGTATILPGQVTAYQFDVNGRVVRQETATVSAVGPQRIDSRSRIRGRGIYLHVASGPLAGWWVAEDPAQAWMDQPVVERVFPLARPTDLPGVSINRTGVVHALDAAQPVGGGQWVPMSALRPTQAAGAAGVGKRAPASK